MMDSSAGKTSPTGIVPAQVAIENGCILHDRTLSPPPGSEFFEPTHWQSEGAVTGAATGRGSVCIFRYRDRELALRHYHRGGWAARLSRDRYLWTRLDRTRAWREWHLLAELYGLGLPVPRPVAARVLRHGPLYSADLVTAYLPETRSLADCLIDGPLAEEGWREIGRTLRCFHDHHVLHADLNARNILLGRQGMVYVVDFDKGRRGGFAAGSQLGNLARLQHSLRKFAAHEAVFHYDEKARGWLLAGYREGG